MGLKGGWLRSDFKYDASELTHTILHWSAARVAQQLAEGLEVWTWGGAYEVDSIITPFLGKIWKYQFQELPDNLWFEFRVTKDFQNYPLLLLGKNKQYTVLSGSQ